MKKAEEIPAWLLRERWNGMIRRTSDSRHHAYPSYGGRGIKVCDRWKTYANFLEDMGPTFQTGLTLDRIDVDGNYEPGNVRWATAAQQARNRRDTVTLTWQRRTMPLPDWADRLGISADSLSRRLRRGWSTDRALSTPPNSAPHTRHEAYLRLLHTEDALLQLIQRDDLSDPVREQLAALLDSLTD
jgi:hypothetical protein